eukprot:CAMPEP_0170549130 /NCGR_PEP_ID=MMETSP0211-20121228/7327_1 /TAXON_ID=311385 /ORGANISM="Pseudokeronopsis sp., Strain OXSARD2" /LENGTH=142 /DNA_ID=CAMNT_0010854983 /DNA_START=291 /DNA_END=719 /DNA_ORIENTATION=+
MIKEIPLDIIINFAEIRDHLVTGKDHFEEDNFIEAGYSFGSALALGALNADGSPSKVLKRDYYVQYLFMSGYTSEFGATQKQLTSMYEVAQSYGKDFKAGFLNVFRNGRKFRTPMDGSLFLHQMSFVINHSMKQIQKEAKYM